MVAETFVEAITVIVFLAIPILLIVSAVSRIRSRRREEMLIRQWCDPSF